MEKLILEICANSLTSALTAQLGGADRIELCENLNAGGTTPGFGTLSLARKFMYIPIHVLIRPRPGDFLYNDSEFATMKMDINACKELELNGVVLGILNEDGSIDKDRCRQLVELARPMSVTFHRAFDMCNDPIQALEDIIELGFDRLLTSGQSTQVPDGALLIHKLVAQAADRIKIMPGSGINAENLHLILRATLAKEVHMSAGEWYQSAMQFRHPHTRLANDPKDDYQFYATSLEKVKLIRDLLDTFVQNPDL